MSTVNLTEQEDPKPRFHEKLAAIITGGYDTFISQVVQMFLLLYYTDMLKINASFVVVMFLVCRITDAVIAPIFGIYVDKTNTRWGKYKPWCVILNIIIGIVV